MQSTCSIFTNSSAEATETFENLRELCSETAELLDESIRGSEVNWALQDGNIHFDSNKRRSGEPCTQDTASDVRYLDTESDARRDPSTSAAPIDWVVDHRDQELVEGATIVESFSSAVVQQDANYFPLLFPGLVDNNLAFFCLSRLGLTDRYRLRAVCKGWKAALSSDALYSARTALGLLEENFVVLYFTDSEPYLRICSPTTGESFRLAPVETPSSTELENLRLTVAGKMVYLFSTKKTDSDYLVTGYDTIRNSWQSCKGLGTTGKHLVASADWISGQLFVASNNVSEALIGKRPECNGAAVAIWDPNLQCWEQCEKVPPWLNYCYLTSAASAQGSFLLFMIEVVSGSLRAAQYDPLDKSWKFLARFPTSSPQVTCLNGELYGLASGVLWHLVEENWEYLTNLPGFAHYCRVHGDCDEACKPSLCEELLLRFSGEVCAVRSWLAWLPAAGRWTVKTSIQLLDTQIYSEPPVPAAAWETLDLSFDDACGVIAGCGVAIS